MTDRLLHVLLLGLALAAPAGAQTAAPSPQPPSARAAADFPDDPSPGEGRGGAGYLTGHFGMTSTSDATAPVADAEAGFRLSTRVSVFGAYGLFRNLNPSTFQPFVDIAVTQIAQRKISVSGEAREPAQYAWAGLRVDVPTALHVTPYVVAGGGWARSTPSAKFTYASGSATIDGGTATAGEDATSDVRSTGVFLGDSWSAAMIRVGAGLSIPVRTSWAIEGRYLWTRILAPTPVTTQGLTAGLAFRF